jgi:hypothetical protein
MKTIFLDVDGVIADFVGGVRKLYEMPDDWVPKTYMFSQSDLGMTWDEFSKRVNNTLGFWTRMETCADGMEFLNEIRHQCISYGVPIVCLTAPMQRCDDFYTERLDWISRHVVVDDVIFAVRKHHIAAPGKLLIDDCDSNVDAWRAAGGTAILWPRPWNSAGIEGVDSKKMPFYLDQVKRFIAYEEPNKTELCECGELLTRISKGNTLFVKCDKCGSEILVIDDKDCKFVEGAE